MKPLVEIESKDLADSQNQESIASPVEVSSAPGSTGIGALLAVFRRDLGALTGLVILVVVIVLALVAPLLPLPDPIKTNTSQRLLTPGNNGYLLGSDQLGRDILSRLIWGARVSVMLGFISVLIASSVGTLLGLLAGYYGRWVDNVIGRFVDVLISFPYVLLAIALVAALGPGLFNAMLAVSIVNISFYARGVRSAVLVTRGTEFIEAARALGASDFRIITREILPNIISPIIVFISLNIGTVIVDSAGLSFIGLGAQPPDADWGTMLADGRQFITIAYHVTLIPGLAILLVVLGSNLIGDALRDTLDPRLRK